MYSEKKMLMIIQTTFLVDKANVRDLEYNLGDVLIYVIDLLS